MLAGRRDLPPRAIGVAKRLLAPWAWLTAPRFYGIQNVPRHRPVLLAGNHTLMGVLDVPLMVLGILDRRGVFVRPLGDRLHFHVPGWRDLLRLFGTVEGTPDNCRALMRARETILVFPGGGREVFKRKGEQYRLLWGERAGFVRLAIEHGYPIVPFAAVGAEECYDILLDAGDVLRLLPPLRLLPRSDEIPPLVRGVGLSLLPRPQRFYFHFGQAIETRHLAGLHQDEAVCLALRGHVRAAVEAGLAFLLSERAHDPERALLARLVRQLGRQLPGAGRPSAAPGSGERAGTAPAAAQRLRAARARRPRPAA
jgi:1-acyl-sn-glycerol-3-phosphate acyltransferase